MKPPANALTGLGFVAVLFWGTSIAVGRLVLQDLGLVRGPLMLSLTSGTLGVILLAARRGELAKLRGVPARYWVVCGGLFVLYIVAYNFGVGMAQGGRQILIFGILNYLWPVLTLVFAALFSRLKVRPWLAAGIGLAVAGTCLALIARQEKGGVGMSGLLADVGAHPPVYVLGLLCGISWGLFSSLGRRLAGPVDANPVPVFFLATAAVYAVLFAVGAGRDSGATAPSWTLAAIGAFAWRALVTDLLAYVCWDAAMRRGNQIHVAVASFFTPLLSTACIALILAVAPGWQFWAACLLLTAGAALSRFSVIDAKREER